MTKKTKSTPRNRRTLTAEEKRLWHYVTRNDKRLSQIPDDAIETEEALPDSSEKRKLFVKNLSPLPSVKQPKTPLKKLRKGDYADIDRNTATRFRKGDYPIDATLDLHGYSRDRAHDRLHHFIQKRAVQGDRCLLVITGKGRADTPGVLRAAIPQWLAASELRPYILTFDTARPKDGGEGAYYILLRRRRQDNMGE